MKRAFLGALIALASASAFANELPGLWKATKRFGPSSGGPLLIRKTKDGYEADYGGHILQAPDLAFDYPSDNGVFRGRIDGSGQIIGHWITDRTSVTSKLISPVYMRPDGEGRWRGVVAPQEVVWTYYLRIDASYKALLRHPERDWGTQRGIDRVTLDGNAIKVMGRNGEAGSGTFDRESDTLTIRFERGGVFEFRREGDDSDFYARGKHPVRYSYRRPTTLDDGWPTGTLEEANIDRAGIEKVVQTMLESPVDAPEAPQFHALLIARHGKVVLEEYFHGQSRDGVHDTRSASKSITSVIVGAAMQAGLPLRLSSKVYTTMEKYVDPAKVDDLKRAMTLEDLITMSGGFFCDDTNDAAPGNEETMQNQEEEPDWYRYTLRVPMATPPGENAVYCSASPNLALGMVGEVAHESPAFVFDRLVARPMNIRNYLWFMDPAGHPFGGGGMQITARDFMKFGQMILNGGTWEGKRIVSADFARRTFSRPYHLRNVYYSYLWWSEDYPYKNRTVRTFSARGAGGQTVTVIPELDLIITTMAGNYASRKGTFAASTDPIPRTILPAIREAGDDKRAPVIEVQYTSPYGPSKDGSRFKKKD